MKPYIVVLGICGIACDAASPGAPSDNQQSSAGESPRDVPEILAGPGTPASTPGVPVTAGPPVPAAEQALSPEAASAASAMASEEPAAASSPAESIVAPEAFVPPAGSSAPGAAEETPVETPVAAAPAEETPVDAPLDDAPLDDAPLDDAPLDALADETPAVDPPGGDAPAVENGAPTVTVSFTFDDTYGPQVEAAAILEAYGQRGTFYVNSPELHRAAANPSANGPMSITEVLDMQARGHDIGGHTLGHLSLTDIPEAERVREILGDRAQLVQLGIDARSFAYPSGHVEADDPALGRPVLEIARESGYTSARDTNGFDLEDCSTGPESLPPADPFGLVSIRSVNEPPEGAELRLPADTAETLLGWVDRAASCGGGWLPLVFHRLSADCTDPEETYCFEFAELDRLASALASGVRCPDGTEGGCYRVQVETVSAAIGVDELAPAPEVPGLRNASLERTLDSGETECIRHTGSSPNVVFGRSELANGGQASERLEVAAPFDGAAEIGVQRDFGECAIFASEGHAYELSLHYRAEPESEAPTLRFVTYRLTAAYDWVPWQSGSAFTARSPGEWVRLAFTTESVPTETLAISFGLRQESPGALNVDDLGSVPLGAVGAND